jgi:protocatechuate 3,4-dioxygenase beta subunit
LIEIWQCDAFGAYHHPRDGGGLDPFFQGYGKTITDDGGRYRFKTIKPVAYPGRAPHIHFRVLTNSKELVTQIYVRGNPENENDFLLNSISDETARQSLIIPFEEEAGKATDDLVAIFNPVIA